MKLLLDTHTFLWWITDNSRLSAKAQELIEDKANQLFFSAVSGWELAIKARLGRLTLSDDLEAFIASQLALNQIDVLSISLKHALHIYTLPDYHKDPFDRLLIAQSQIESMPLLTVDPQIGRYAVTVIW